MITPYSVEPMSEYLHLKQQLNQIKTVILSINATIALYEALNPIYEENQPGVLSQAHAPEKRKRFRWLKRDTEMFVQLMNTHNNSSLSSIFGTTLDCIRDKRKTETRRKAKQEIYEVN